MPDDQLMIPYRRRHFLKQVSEILRPFDHAGHLGILHIKLCYKLVAGNVDPRLFAPVHGADLLNPFSYGGILIHIILLLCSQTSVEEQDLSHERYH